jgi:hypothetical protein
VNELALKPVAATPELVQRLIAAYSSDATVEVVGTVDAPARRKVPALGVPQAFPVPLLPAVPVNVNPLVPAKVA